MINVDESTLQELLKRRWEHAGVQFQFNKAPVMKGHAIMEFIRGQIGGEFFSAIVNKAGDDIALAVIGVVLKADPIFVATLRKKMFEYVTFRVPDSRTFSVLSNDEERCFDAEFEGMSPRTVYEVLLRSLAVNFIGFFPETIRSSQKQ